MGFLTYRCPHEFPKRNCWDGLVLSACSQRERGPAQTSKRRSASSLPDCLKRTTPPTSVIGISSFVKRPSTRPSSRSAADFWIHLGDRLRRQSHLISICRSVRQAAMSLTHDADPEALNETQRDAQTHVPPRFPGPSRRSGCSPALPYPSPSPPGHYFEQTISSRPRHAVTLLAPTPTRKKTNRIGQRTSSSRVRRILEILDAPDCIPRAFLDRGSSPDELASCGKTREYQSDQPSSKPRSFVVPCNSISERCMARKPPGKSLDKSHSISEVDSVDLSRLLLRRKPRVVTCRVNPTRS